MSIKDELNPILTNLEPIPDARLEHRLFGNRVSKGSSCKTPELGVMPSLRDEFSSFYPPDEEETARFWNEGHVVVDANILLNLHRSKPELQKELSLLLKFFADKKRLWIPHMVGLEYHRRRLEVINEQNTAIVSALDSAKETCIKELNSYKERHSYIDIDGLVEQIEIFFLGVTKDLDKKQPQPKKTLAEHAKTDAIRDLVGDCEVGPPVTKEELAIWMKDGEERYKKKIPPGYEDRKKPPGVFRWRTVEFEPKYSDLVIWMQILKQFATTESENRVLFVTEDSKEDWWDKRVAGKTIGPRLELREEAESKGIKFWAYNMTSFLQLAPKYTEVQVSPESIAESEQLAEAHGTALAWTDENASVRVGSAYAARPTLDERAAHRARSPRKRWSFPPVCKTNDPRGLGQAKQDLYSLGAPEKQSRADHKRSRQIRLQ